MFLIFVFLVISLILIHDFVKKRSSSWKKLSEFPGDTPLPIIGNAIGVGLDGDQASQRLLEMWKRHGKQNFRVTVGSENWLMLCESEDIKALLNSNVELSKPVERNDAIRPFFGNSLSTSEGERWKLIRKLMAPSFNFQSFESTAGVLNKHIDSLFEVLDGYEGKGPVDMYTYMKPYMMDIVCNGLLGVETSYLKNPHLPFVESSKKISYLLTHNIFSYWRKYSLLVKFTPQYLEMKETVKNLKENSINLLTKRREILNKMIEEAKNDNNNIDINYDTFIKTKLSGGCLLDKLILSISPNADPKMDEIINEEITLLVFSGHSTTSMASSHTMHFLSKHPDIQQKVLEEQKSIFGKDFYRKANVQDLNEMKYLDVVIKETIRHIPVLSRIGRQLNNDMTLSDGRVAPAGTSMTVFFEAYYKNPKIYSDPEKFIPERFFEPMHAFAFLPFSAGPRNCVAFRYSWLMIKLTLCDIIRRYELLPGVEPKFVYRVISESTNGVQLNLKKRNLVH